MANPAQNPFALLADDNSSAVAAAPKAAKKAEPAEAPAKTPAERAAARTNKPPAPKKETVSTDDGFSVQKNRRARGEVAKTPGKESPKAAAAHKPHAAPAHGRPKDRESQAKTTRKPPAKRGGGGKGNWGNPNPKTEGSVSEVLDNVNADVEHPTPVPAEAGEGAETAAPVDAAPAEPEVKQLDFNDYLKKRQEEEAALNAKVGAVAPRKLDEREAAKLIPPKYAADAAEASTGAKTESAAAKKGPKAVDPGLLNFKAAPIAGEERGGRGRGRGRGGRGGRGQDGDRPRGGKGKAPREGADSKPRGGAKGARGGSRGGANGGGRGRGLNPSSTAQFPTLG